MKNVNFVFARVSNRAAAPRRMSASASSPHTPPSQSRKSDARGILEFVEHHERTFAAVMVREFTNSWKTSLRTPPGPLLSPFKAPSGVREREGRILRDTETVAFA